MTTRKPNRFAFTFWLIVFFACDFGLYGVWNVAYHVYEHQTASVEPPHFTPAQNSLYLRDAGRAALAFAQRDNTTVAEEAMKFDATMGEWIIMTAYLMQKNPQWNREDAAGQALIEIQEKRRMELPLIEG